MDRHRVELLCCLLVGIATNALAGDADFTGNWPQFRGPNATGIAAGAKSLPVRFGPKTNLRWRTPLPGGISSACVWGDRIFVTASRPKTKALETICLNRSDGKVRWRKAITVAKLEKTHPISSPAASTPATDGERVYVYFGSFGLLCYGIDGRLLWKHPLPFPKNRHGSGSSPIVVGELVILCCDQGVMFQPAGSFLLAVNRKTGKQVWKRPRPFSSAGWSTPVVWRHDGVRDVVVLGRRVTGYDPQSGKARWHVAGLMDYSVTVPVLGSGLLYVHAAAGGLDGGSHVKLPSFAKMRKQYDADKDGKLSLHEIPKDFKIYEGDSRGLPGDVVTLRSAFPAVDANNDKVISFTEWTLMTVLLGSQKNKLLAIRPGKPGDAAANVAWTEDRRLPEVPSALHYRDNLYLVKNGGIVSCLDGKTGKLRYRKRLGETANYFASPVAGDGKIYAASHRGAVVVFAAGNALKVLAKNALGEAIVATPAIAGGTIYVRTGKALYAFGRD